MSLVSAVPVKKEHRTRNTSRPNSAHGVVGTATPTATVPSTPRTTGKSGVSRTSSIVSNESKASSRKFTSVYHTSDEPLSKEALYRAKLKYGVYESPAKGTSSGYSVSSKTAAAASASASASANDNRAVVDAYKRLIGSETTNRKSESATTIRGQRASAAASKAFANVASASSNVVNVSPQKAYSITSQTSYNYTQGRASSIVSNASSTSAAIRKTPVNFQKVMRGAEDRAGKRVKNRSEPERKNFSYGLRTEATRDTKLRLSHDAMNNLMARATNDALAAETRRTNAKPRNSMMGSHPSLGTGKNTLAESAAFALNAAVATEKLESKTSMMNPEAIKSTSEMAKQEAERKRALLSRASDSERVLAMARQNVERKIKSIEESQSYNLYDNDAYNRAAVSIAKANFKQKQSDAALGKVNMGGGLWMTPQDINLISQNLLSPLLGEINERTTAQRAKDEELAKRTAKYEAALEKWNNLQLEKIENDEKYPIDSERHREELDQKARDTAERRWNRMVDMMETKLNARLQTYNDNKQKFEDVKTEIDMKLEMDQKRADKEIARWHRHQKRDLKAALKEQQELLQPFLDDVQKAEQEHDDLLREYDDINDEIRRLQESITQHKEKIEEYTRHLEEEKEREAKETSELKELAENKENAETDLNENVIVRATKAREEAALSAEQVRLKELELEAMINERKTELSKAEIDLQRERLSLLEAMKGEAELSGNDKLDEEKVKTLVGTSSEEFLEKTRDDPALHDVEGEGEEERSLNTIKEEEELGKSTEVSLPAARPGDVERTEGAHDETESEPELQKQPSEEDEREEGEKGEGQPDGMENISGVSQKSGEEVEAPEPSEKVGDVKEESTKKELEPSVEVPTSTAPAPALTSTSATNNKTDSSSLTPSFSGFSQGSLSSGDEGEEEEEEDDEDDVRVDDISSSQPKDSFLKEVF